ncbi:MAG: protein translocase SEC61 complex subunit gamma [Candidatus Aenigmarchaeota archaeon]|nr:protein translocase SEC61 complex subunit gamma [Candidatus Aenigmarchaeota archaeon]
MLEGAKGKLVSFLGQCKRIMTIATKPSKSDYLSLSKVVAAGVALIGALGFLLYLLFNLVITRFF